MIKRALISVSDKTGLAEFAQRLHQKGVELLSTGGSAQCLREAGLTVTEMSDYTGFPEMMDGRVKTLHPKVHGGLLAIRENQEHMKAAQEHDIGMIDLVIVNLYPFEATIQKEGVTLEEAIEKIDIGGPSMLRSAAKNFSSVTVVTDPEDYGRVMEEIEKNGDTSPALRRQLAEKVFELTARYDGLIAESLSGGVSKHLWLEKVEDLRYGENPHQEAAFYREQGKKMEGATLANAKKIQGKALSYNNIMDADAALSLAREFAEPTAVVVKHANPCGVGTGSTIQEAYQRAFEADSKSAFGGIVALNRPCTGEMAQKMTSHFFEVVLATEFEPEALKQFETKPNVRLLAMGELKPQQPSHMLRQVYGGVLMQKADSRIISKDDLKIVTQQQPTPQQLEDLLFAWHIVKHVKSNAIALAKNGQTVGIGAGQMSRVDSVELAIKKAEGKQQGAVMASDAFFPFPDSIEEAAKHGITAIIQPGGSIKDKEVIAAANQHGIAMVFTEVRVFLH